MASSASRVFPSDTPEKQSTIRLYGSGNLYLGAQGTRRFKTTSIIRSPFSRAKSRFGKIAVNQRTRSARLVFVIRIQTMVGAVLLTLRR